MSRKRSIRNISVHILIALVFLANQLYAGDYLSPESDPPSRGTLRHLRVLVASGRPEVRELASTWNPVKIGLQTEVDPGNIRVKRGVLPKSALPRLNKALGLIKERSASRGYREFFNLDLHQGSGPFGRWFSERYLLQNLVLFEGPFLSDMAPGHNSHPQTSMLNLILFSDLVHSTETLIYALRHEMDHANPLTEREIKDRDILYFKTLTKKAQDEIIDDLGRIEEAVRVAQESVLAGAYKERTREGYVERLQKYREILYLAQLEGLSERSKEGIREFAGMKRREVRSFDRVPISYTVGGKLDSPITLLFLHAWTSQSKDWRRQIAEFEHEYKIVTIDTRGFGKSGQGDYSEEFPHIDHWVRDIHAVIQRERLDNIVVLGHSMGGMVGFNLCLDRDLKDKIVGFVPIASTAAEPSESFINDFFSNLLVRSRPGFRKLLTILTKPKVAALIGKIQKGWVRNSSVLEALARVPARQLGLTTQEQEDFHHLWTNSFGETNLRDSLAGYLGMCTHDVVDRLRDIKIPVLWIRGCRDRTVLPEVQERHAEMIPDCRSIPFDESGHFPHWDEWERANSLIRELLERLSGVATSGTRVRKGKFSIRADIGPNWSRYGDEWANIPARKNRFKEAIEEIVASGEFNEQDVNLIQRITFVSGNDKLAMCNRDDGQIVLDIRSFKNKDLLRLEIIHELWHLKLANLRSMAKLGEINPLIEEMFVIVNQILGFFNLSPGAQERYLNALARDTDTSEKGLYQILARLKAEEITDIQECYPMVRELILTPDAFRFSEGDRDAFRKLTLDEIEDKLYQLTNALLIEEDLESTGRYKAVASWQEIERYIEGLITAGKKPEHILVDLDMTVFAPYAYLGSNAWFRRRKKEIGVHRALWEWGDNERRMTKHGFYRLVEARIPRIIEKWKEQGIDVVGFTARQWVKDSSRTQKILRQLGVRFSHVRSVPGIYYHKGVIYTFGSGEPKAKALRKLLKGAGSGTTVLIDDGQPNVVNVLRDRELQNVHGLLYKSPVEEELEEKTAQDYIQLADEAIEQEEFDPAINYCLNAVEQARYLDGYEKSSVIREVWYMVAKLKLIGKDTTELTRFIIQYDETKYDLRIMDERLRDPHLNLLAEKPPITDPETSRALYCKIDESTDLDNLKRTFRILRRARRQNRYPKFRIILTSDLPLPKIRRKVKKAGLDERIDYDLWFVPKPKRTLLGVLRKRFKDLVSISDSDIITVDVTDQSLPATQLIYQEIAKTEGYRIPVTHETEPSPFSKIDLVALREEARRKNEFLAKNNNGRPIVLFYHTDSDGVAAAAAETRFLKEYFGYNIEITYIPVNYNEPLPIQDIPQDAMWIVVDFAYEEFSKKLGSGRNIEPDPSPSAQDDRSIAGVPEKGILFQDHHDEHEPEIPDDVIYISPRSLKACVASGQYSAGLLTTVLNGEVLRQSKDIVDAALYLEQTSWIGALAIYGDYTDSTWADYLSAYDLAAMGLDELSKRITAVTSTDSEAVDLPLRNIIYLSEPPYRLSREFEKKADKLYRHLRDVTRRIGKKDIIFYHLTEEDLVFGDISKMLADHLKHTFNSRLVVVGVEKEIGGKKVLVLHARAIGVNAGELMQGVSEKGGGHAEAGGAVVELGGDESSTGVFRRVQEQIMRTLQGARGDRSSGTRVKGGETSVLDSGWPDDETKDKYTKALSDIVKSGEFKQEDLELIRKVTLVSDNDKLAECDRAEGQVILDVRAFKNQDLLRLELIHELWHLKLADLRRKDKLGEVNPLVEEMFVILNQIQGFFALGQKAREAYLEALAQDTDESEKGLYQILTRVKDVRAAYSMVKELVLTPEAFRFSDADVSTFRRLNPEDIQAIIDTLFQLKDVLRIVGAPPDAVELKRYKKTRREITSVIRLEGKGRKPGGEQRLARILLRPDGFIKESHWDKRKRRFTGKDLGFLQQVFQQAAKELKERFMQINVEELEIFKDMEVIVVPDSDHLIYYREEGEGKKQLVIDKKAFYSKELLLMELERIIGETLMRSMTRKLPPDRVEVVYTLYLSVERFLRFSKAKQKEILAVLKKRFPENPIFRELLVKVKGKDLTKKSQWNNVINEIVEFILVEGIYPPEVQGDLMTAGTDRIKKLLWGWIQVIELQIQVGLAFRSYDPQMRNLALNYLVKNAKKLRLKEILLSKPSETVPLGLTKFKLGRIAKLDSSIRCLRSGLFPNRLILVNGQGRFLLVEKLGSYIRISNRSYKLESDDATVDLTGVLQEPKLWIGNYSLVDFFGDRFEELLGKLRSPPSASGLTLDSIPKDKAELARRVVSPAIRNDALKYLKQPLTRASLALSPRGRGKGEGGLPSSPKARKKVSLTTFLLHIHHYFTLMSTGDVNDFGSAQQQVEALSKDKRLKTLVPWLLQHLGISKQFQVLEGLNDQQFKAVTAPAGPTIVIAGAGTGKTRVIVRRLAHILNSEEDVKPENVLAITFTQKASAEIAERVEEMVGTMRERIQISTFHSFGYRMLQDHGYLLGLPRNIRVLDGVEQWQFFRSLLPRLKKEALKYYWRRQDPSAAIAGFIDFINRAKDNLVSPRELMEYARAKKDFKLIEAAKVYKVYQEELLARGYLDYGDLIRYPVKLLEGQPEIQARYREQYKHILVDEFQDTNYSQIRLLQLLGNNVFAVGDDDQAIYQFRGASDASFSLFQEIYPGAKHFKLTQNYRSQPNVIECANGLISHNEFRFDPQKNLWTTKQRGEPVEAWVSPDYKDEALAIADEIQRIYEKTGDYSQVAVLYRAHRHNREVISALEAKGIPYVVKGGIPLLNRKEIRDLIAYMKFINDPGDVVSFFRLLHTSRFKVPDTQWVKLAEFMEKNNCGPWEMLGQLHKVRGISPEVRAKLKMLREYLTELMETALREDVRTVFNRLWEGYLEDLVLRGEVKEANTYIRKFSDFIEAYLEINPDNPGLASFMEHLETYILAGGDPERAISEEKPVNAVQLMTVHRAKGLEFPYVFLINLSQTRFPSRFQRDPIPLPSDLTKTVHSGDPKEMHRQEERRTMYVGMSRAQEKLYLCGVKKKYHPLSQFVKEVLELGEGEEVLVSRDIPAAEEVVDPDEILRPFGAQDDVAGHVLKQELLDLRTQLVMAVERLGKPKAKGLLDIFRICLAIAQVSLMINNTNPAQAQRRLERVHKWTRDMLATNIERFTRQAMAQDASEILGAIPVAQPSGLGLPRPFRFSFTQIATYMDNPQRYKERYMLGIPGFEAGHKALRFGKFIHELLEELNHSLVKGRPIPLAELKGRFTERLRQELPELTKKRDFKAYLRRGYTILEKFYKRKENLIKPIGIEKEFELKIGDDVIFGYIDCIRELPDGKLQIMDYKTGSSEEGFHDKYRLQLLIYALWAKTAYDKEPEDLVLTDYYVEEDKHVSFIPTAEDLAWAEGKAREIIDKIKKEVYGERIAEEKISPDELLLRYRRRRIEELSGEIRAVPKDDFLGKALIYIRLGRLSDQVDEPKKAQRYYRLGLKWLGKVARQAPVDAPEEIKPVESRRIRLGNVNINLGSLYKVVELGKNRYALYWKKKFLPIEKYISRRHPRKQYLRIGNKVYELVPGTKTINLEEIIAQPKYWNSGFASFFGPKFMLENRKAGPEAERPPPIRLVRELPSEIKDRLSPPVITESERTQAILPEWETTLEKIIRDLDPPQLEAVTTTEGPLLVLGAPGTGKTITLLRRAAYILHSHRDIPPESVLVLTDSKESVEDFRDGLRSIIGSRGDKVSISTPRNISWQILRKNASLLGLSQRFSTANKAEQRLVLRRLWPNLDIKHHAQLSEYPDIIDGLIDYFIQLQRELIFADQYVDYAKWSGSEKEQELARIYKAWEDAMRDQGMVGYEQLVPLAVKMLKDNPPSPQPSPQGERVRVRGQDEFNYLLVNRLQDLSFSEFTLLELLANKSKNICVVGDENMGVGQPRIDPRRNFRLFLEKFSGAKTVLLKQNYRSPRRILAVARKMLDSVYAELDERSPAAEARTTRGRGEKVKVVVAGDDQEEARAIVEEIKRLYDGLPEDKRDYRRFAVLTKTISAQRYIIEALENENIPYVWDIEESLFEREEVKDLLALISVFTGQASDLSLTRFLRASIPQASAVEIKRIADFMKAHEATLRDVLENPEELILSSETKSGLDELKELFAGLQPYVDDVDLFIGEWFKQTDILKKLTRIGTLEADTKAMNLGKFVRFVRKYAGNYPKEKSVLDFWNYLEMYRKSGGDIPSVGLVGEPQGVYVSTITRAGDRGFDNVFISGITAGRFPVVPPRRDAFETPEELLQETLLSPEYSFLEEARLLYLGMTKARERLYLTGVAGDGLSKFLRVILEETPKEIEYQEVERGDKGPPLSRYQRLYMMYQDQLMQQIGILSGARNKREWNKAWQGIVNTIWNISRLQTTHEAVLSEEDAPARIESMDKILARIISTKLPQALGKELTAAQRKKWLDLLRFPERFIEQIPVPKEFRLSHTRIETYEGCPYAYKLKYVFKLPAKTTAALTFGKVMHEVMEYIYTRMNKRRKPTLDEVMKYYEAHWSSEGYEDKIQERDYKEFGRRIIKGYYAKNIKGLIKLPETKLEEKFLVEIGGIPVLGFIDKIDVGEDTITDFKTGKPKSKKDAETSIQLTIYAYAYNDMFGRLPELVEFYNLTSNDRVSAERTSEDLAELEKKVAEIAGRIRSQEFAPKDGFRCRWCPFTLICPAHGVDEREIQQSA